MAASSFPAALAHVLASEGGYVDHPADPGGATKFGITLKTLSAWRGAPVSKADVKALTKTEAGAIYRARYWDKIAADDLPAGLDLAVFDLAVNSGVARAKAFLQEIGVGEAQALINALCDRRLAFLKGLSTWPVFGKGWGRRVVAVRKAALAMAGRV
jgi:lysozyme family protein